MDETPPDGAQDPLAGLLDQVLGDALEGAVRAFDQTFDSAGLTPPPSDLDGDLLAEIRKAAVQYLSEHHLLGDDGAVLVDAALARQHVPALLAAVIRRLGEAFGRDLQGEPVSPGDTPAVPPLRLDLSGLLGEAPTPPAKDDDA